MHEDFADWYRSVVMSPNAELLERRWLGITAILENVTRETVIAALRVLTLPKTDPSVVLGETFTAAFKEADAAFPLRDNAEELRVLAGAFIHALIEQSEPTTLTDLAAMGLVAAGFAGRDARLPNVDHLTRARQFVHERARDLRSTGSLGELPKRGLTQSAIDALKAQCDTNSATNLGPPLTTLFAAISAQLQAIQSDLWEELRVQNARLDTQDEELKLLWWLQTSVSRDLGVPFANVGAAAPVILASEVAALVSQVPGPSFATDLLVQALIDAGQGESKCSITEVLNATTNQWRRALMEVVDPKPLGALCPVTFAISCSLETDEPDAWHPIYRKHCEISLSQAFPTLQLAAQFYNERMFLEAWQNV